MPRRNRFSVALLVGLFAGAGACARAPESSCPPGVACDCIAKDDCGGEQVCFLGRCVDPGFNPLSVHIEVLPPSSSTYLAQVDAGSPRDLSAGLAFDVTLASPVTWSGGVQRTDGSLLSGGLLSLVRVRADGGVLLPNLQVTTNVPLANGAFSVRAMPGSYMSRIAPQDSALPPFFMLVAVDNTDAAALAYPADADLRLLSGRLARTQADVSSGIADAQVAVSIPAQDSGDAPIQSTTTLTDLQGNFEVRMLSDPRPLTVSIAPAANLEVPSVVLSNWPLVDSSAGTLEAIYLDLPPPTPLSARVVDITGAPSVGTTVIFRGEAGAHGGQFVATGYTDVQGDIRASVTGAAVQLFATRYDVTLLPDRASADGLTVIADFAFPPSAAVVFEVRRKVRVSGRVLAHDGGSVGGARLRFLRETQSERREFLSTSADDGTYVVDIDGPSSADEALRYEVIIEPPASALQARGRGVLDIGAAGANYDAVLAIPSFASGRVLGADGQPEANVILGFYLTDALGTPEEPFLLGIGQTDANGEFVVALPSL